MSSAVQRLGMIRVNLIQWKELVIGCGLAGRTVGSAEVGTDGEAARR